MSDLPFMPLFVDAYESDTGHLSDVEHGRYLRLLMLMWKSPGCRVPNDDAWLARKLRRSQAAIKKEIRPLIDEFCSTTGNWLTQNRLKKEWKRANARSKIASVNAKSRWKKEKLPSERNAGTHEVGNASRPRPRPIPTVTKEEKKEARKRAHSLPPGFDLTPERRQLAISYGIAPARIEQVWRKFIDHHTAKGSVFKDWNAAWRTWCGNDLDFGASRKQFNGGHDARPTLASAVDDLIARTHADEPQLSWPENSLGRTQGSG